MPDVTCRECLRRSEGLQGARADQVYEAGNPVRSQMGHRMFHTHEGQVSLCALARRPQGVTVKPPAPKEDSSAL